ncbi:MAG: F0F1 ATP synthase subunit B [Microcoleus sp. SIO2G3]|nr:F0F1 ATP synthase subunit B [Microcoleus sp. SIO2G3]
MAIMSTFSFLATAAAEVAAEGGSEGGLGLNFDLLETNLINLVIIIGVLFFFGRKFLGKTLSERRSNIEQAIQDAEKRQKDAAASLADAQQKLAQAQAEAERIRANGEENAQAARAAILEKAAKDVEAVRKTATQDLNADRERAIAELRERVAVMAMQRVESQLQDHLDDSAQQQLIDRSIALLGGGS